MCNINEHVEEKLNVRNRQRNEQSQLSSLDLMLNILRAQA